MSCINNCHENSQSSCNKTGTQSYSSANFKVELKEKLDTIASDVVRLKQVADSLITKIGLVSDSIQSL